MGVEEPGKSFAKRHFEPGKMSTQDGAYAGVFRMQKSRVEPAGIGSMKSRVLRKETSPKPSSLPRELRKGTLSVQPGRKHSIYTSKEGSLARDLGAFRKGYVTGRGGSRGRERIGRTRLGKGDFVKNGTIFAHTLGQEGEQQIRRFFLRANEGRPPEET